MDTGLFAPRVATYATPNRVYGSMDSTTMLAVNSVLVVTLPIPAGWFFPRIHRMRAEMSVVQRTFVAITTVE